MGILEKFNREEEIRNQLWDRLPDYEALGMSEDDIDIDFLDEE